MAKQISQTYGNALFELAVEQNNLEQMMQEVVFIKQCLEENEDLMKVLNHPKIPKDEKITLLETVFKGQVSEEMSGFLAILLNKDRQSGILEIFDYFMHCAREYKKIGELYVTSAVTLSAVQKEQIEARVLELTSYVSLEVKYEVDESLIGGLVLRINDRVVDSSIKTKLANMTKSLI
ncbi:MAG: F0F1 ATP synthase subunit delta [Lachnospiraceae bacterium]|nr:F0F1 ATP synthase subunit delta [Lachnospiraceae bacterium]